MTTADQVISALHADHDDLAPLVGELTLEQLTGPSPDTEWTLAQVLSHLGSGAVITKATFEAALAGEPNPGGEANQAVWAVWNAMSPQEQADGFLAANVELLALLDSIDPLTRESLSVDMGFLPQPVDLAVAARFRLSEFALHAWDVRAALDPTATVHPVASPLLLDQLAMLFGWLAKPANLDRPAVLRVDLTDLGQSFGLELADATTLADLPGSPDGVLTLPAETWLRLVTGRLRPEYTPDTVTVTGPATLDDLRAVFPGF